MECDMQNRRNAPRCQAMETGVAVMPSMSARCVIEEISDSGARLTFPYAPVLPWHFLLRFDKDGREEHVQMIWRNTATVGVSFSRPIRMPEAVRPSTVHAEAR